MLHAVAHLRKIVSKMHRPLVQAHPVRAAGTFVAAMTPNTTVLLVNAVIPMTNQSFGVVMPVFRERTSGIPTIFTFLKNANGQLRKYAQVHPELFSIHVNRHEQPLTILLQDSQGPLQVKNLVLKQRENSSLLKNLDLLLMKAKVQALAQILGVDVVRTLFPGHALHTEKPPRHHRILLIG